MIRKRSNQVYNCALANSPMRGDDYYRLIVLIAHDDIFRLYHSQSAMAAHGDCDSRARTGGGSNARRHCIAQAPRRAPLE